VQNDGGLLFALALIVFIGSAVILVIRRHQIAMLPILSAWWRQTA
jgi:hypothetical protein